MAKAFKEVEWFGFEWQDLAQRELIMRDLICIFVIMNFIQVKTKVVLDEFENCV